MFYYHVNLRNLWLEIVGKRYPEESWDLDWDSNNYCLSYTVFQYFKRIFIKTNSIPYVDKKDFKKLYPIYSADLSDQSQIISSTKCNIILHVDFNKDISPPSGTNGGINCYIVVDSKYLCRHNPSKI
jgi:hypothetical protein